MVDITEHHTQEGKLYLCVIKDLCSRLIVGYAIDRHMRSPLAVAALNDAMVKHGYPSGVIVHSDRGSQFRCHEFLAAIGIYNARGPMGCVGAAENNAAMESFSRYCKRPCSTARGGVLAGSFPRLSLIGSNARITVNTANEHWEN